MPVEQVERAVELANGLQPDVVALTGSLGRHGGNIGSYAGTYKNTLFSGIGRWTVEDPFAPQLDPSGPIKTRIYLRPESMHYWDVPVKVGLPLIRRLWPVTNAFPSKLPLSRVARVEIDSVAFLGPVPVAVKSRPPLTPLIVTA